MAVRACLPCIAMDREKAAFAQRLHTALREAGLEASPTALEKRFNSRYDGPPVTTQAISGWLSGRYMPRLDKLRVLAELVGVDLQVLQYGGTPRIGESRPVWDTLAPQDRAMLDAFFRLTAPRRKLVRELVAALSIRSGRSVE